MNMFYLNYFIFSNWDIQAVFNESKSWLYAYPLRERCPALGTAVGLSTHLEFAVTLAIITSIIFNRFAA